MCVEMWKGKGYKLERYFRRGPSSRQTFQFDIFVDDDRHIFIGCYFRFAAHRYFYYSFRVGSSVTRHAFILSVIFFLDRIYRHRSGQFVDSEPVEEKNKF